MTGQPGWHEPLLAGAEPVAVALARRNPTRWPGYAPRTAVTAWRGPRAVLAVWDFSVFGGSFGEDDATVLAAAAAEAVRLRRPLVTVVRSGGTRLQEGMAALVGIPRARLALRDVAAAGLPHLSVADAPTTGGVWISVVSQADLRVAVEGATVGFAGPRVVEAFTGSLPAPGSHTARSSYDAGLVDALLPPDQVVAWVALALDALSPGRRPAGDPSRLADPPSPGVSGRDQVARARARTTDGAQLLASLLTGGVPLRAPRGDETVAACVGRLNGRPVVGVAVAARLGGRPTPNGYRLAARAYRLAGRLGLPVVSLVDTPGADPGTASEEDGIAGAMGEALDALLVCPSPTLAVVHGEGGSGGALAAAATDAVLVTPDGYFAAIAPEGAAAALRRPADECADLMRVTPADLVALGVVDAVVDVRAIAGHLDRLVEMPGASRLARRWDRWRAPLPGNL